MSFKNNPEDLIAIIKYKKQISDVQKIKISKSY